jgi:DNA repair exonuclease SbcCD ATPase subunit
MTQDTLTSIDNLEQELAELQEQLQASIPLLSTLNDIPKQFTDLAERCRAMSTAAAAAQVQADLLAATRKAQEQQIAEIVAESSEREKALGDQWQAFRTGVEDEQHHIMSVLVTTREESTERAALQDKLVASLDERMEKMNQALANMAADLQEARHKQKVVTMLLTAIMLLTLGLSAAAAWFAFF